MGLREIGLAACVSMCLPFGGGRAQALPPAAAPAVVRPHHAHHRRQHAAPIQSEATLPVMPQPRAQAGSPGTTPAPMPNEDAGPPRAPAEAATSVDPGNLSIHYPPLGNGYLPGSSPQDMANTQTPKVPGVTVKVPLEQARPTILPDPDPPPGAAPDAH